MSSTEQLLHFSLGPVQGFIADARRTRDLWAGSFLLSWLAGHAMAALVEEAEKIGRDARSVIIFPDVLPDAMFRAIRGEAGEQPWIGSLPNRFKADVTGMEQAGELCRDAVLQAWERVESAVFECFIEPAANGRTREIWERQCNSFWDMTWVQGPPEQDATGLPLDGAWLDQRKNWRTRYSGEPEGGDLCHQMGNLQEISGFTRLGERNDQVAFWSSLVSQGRISPLDVREGEHLCAVALVKRLFPLIAEDITGWPPGGEVVDIVHWPSTSYIAALPWLKKAADLHNRDQSAYWSRAQDNLSGNFMGEAASRLFGLPKNGLFKLDGHLYHQDGVRAWPEDELAGDTLKDKASARNRLLEGLVETQSTIGSSASEFYAVLIMDGDSIGARIREQSDLVKTGLGDFTDRVRRHFDPSEDEANPSCGVLIYAGGGGGGGDVLALVPVDTAIEAARTLCGEYQAAFAAAGAAEGFFTMSGAIVYAQYSVPLQAVLAKAHHYLDTVAKERNGRDSLALAVMKPGGIAFDWVSCWDGDPLPQLECVADDRSAFSGSLFCNLRDRYAALFETGEQPDREIEPAFADPGLMAALLRAEYVRQGGVSRATGNTDRAVSSLMAIGRPHARRAGVAHETKAFSFDGLLLASFLSGELTGNRVKGSSDGR